MTSSIRRTFPAWACAYAMVSALSAMPAAAQAPPEPQTQPQPQAQPEPPLRPEPGPTHRQQSALFRGAQRPMRDIVGLSVSTYGAYDDQLTTTGEGEGGGVRGVAGGGPYAGVDFGLSVTPNMTGRFTFDAELASGIRYYENVSQFVAATQGAAVNAGYRFTRRTTLQTRGGFSYSPYLDFTNPLALDPNQPIGPERVRDYTNPTRRTVSYDGSVDLTRAAIERPTP
jgi:hypothetical protein